MAEVGEETEGTVVWFNPAKGYGFVAGPSGEHLFVHFTQIQKDGYKSLEEGERVRFVIADGPKGKQANAVRPVDWKAAP